MSLVRGPAEPFSYFWCKIKMWDVSEWENGKIKHMAEIAVQFSFRNTPYFLFYTKNKKTLPLAPRTRIIWDISFKLKFHDVFTLMEKKKSVKLLNLLRRKFAQLCLHIFKNVGAKVHWYSPILDIFRKSCNFDLWKWFYKCNNWLKDTWN